MLTCVNFISFGEEVVQFCIDGTAAEFMLSGVHKAEIALDDVRYGEVKFTEDPDIMVALITKYGGAVYDDDSIIFKRPLEGVAKSLGLDWSLKDFVKFEVTDHNLISHSFDDPKTGKKVFVLRQNLKCVLTFSDLMKIESLKKKKDESSNFNKFLFLEHHMEASIDGNFKKIEAILHNSKGVEFSVPLKFIGHRDIMLDIIRDRGGILFESMYEGVSYTVTNEEFIMKSLDSAVSVEERTVGKGFQKMFIVKTMSGMENSYYLLETK